MIAAPGHLGCGDSHDLASFSGRWRECTQPGAVVPAAGAAGSAATQRDTVGRRPFFEWGGWPRDGWRAGAEGPCPARLALRPLERPGRTARQPPRGLAVVLRLAAGL